MNFVDLLEKALANASPGPWKIHPRHVREADRIAAGEDPLEVAATSEEAFLGWEFEGPEEPGRGDMRGPDAALACLLRNHGDEILALLRGAARIGAPAGNPLTRQGDTA